MSEKRGLLVCLDIHIDGNYVNCKVQITIRYYHAQVMWPVTTYCTLSYTTPQCIGYISGHVTLWCLNVDMMVYASNVVLKKNMGRLMWNSFHH